MHYSTWTSGQFQSIGQPSQNASQCTTTPWNQQAGTSNTSLLYSRSNNVYSTQNTLDLQTPVGHHQAVSFQQPVGGHTNIYSHKVLQCSEQTSWANAQNGNPLATHPDIHQGSGFISSSSQPRMMKASNIHPQQAMSGHWQGQSVEHHKQPLWTMNVGSHSQHCRTLNCFNRNVNEKLFQTASGYTTTSSSSQQKDVTFSNRLVSLATHNNQTAYTGHGIPSRTQNELCPVAPPPYDMKNKCVEQILQVSSISQKTKQCPSSVKVTDNSTLEAIHEKNKQQTIARIADYLRNSCPRSSDGCPPTYINPSCRGKQYASKETTTESNQNKLSVTLNASKGHKLSVPQSPSLCFRPNSDHSFNFRTQHSAEGLQQKLVPTVFSDIATGDGDISLRQANDNVGKTANEMIPQSNKVVERNPAGLLTAATRAVAVVQPSCSETTNEVPDKSLINLSSAFTDGTSVSCLGSAEHQVISQKHICADDTDSELAKNVQVDQHVALNAQQSITSQVPINPSCDGDKNEIPTNPKASYFELSSVPTIPWTIDKLTNMILDCQKAQFKPGSNSMHVSNWSKILRFWHGSIKNGVSIIEDNWYRHISERAERFCRDQVTSETVILSQVEHNFERKLQSHHVLKDNDVYSETPYKSPWLNVSEQLDDIDKEFGFPFKLKCNVNGLGNHKQPDQASKVNRNPAQILNEEPNEVLAPKEQLSEPVDSSEEKQPFSDNFTSTQAPSPKETNSDPYYSVEIQVLPPEEAKLIYEQVQYDVQPSKDADSLPDRVCGSVEDQPSEAADITMKGSKPVQKSVSSVEEICCLSKWLEQICGQKYSMSKCQCKSKQSLTDSPANTFSQEEMCVQMDDSLCVIMSDRKPLIGENQVKGNESTNSEMKVSSHSEPYDALSQIMLSSEKYLNDTSQISTNDQSNVISQLENKDEDLPRSGTEIQSDTEMDDVQGQFESKESITSDTSVSSDNDIVPSPRSDSEVGSQISDLEQNCRQALSSLETEEQPQINALEETVAVDHDTAGRKRDRPSSHDNFFPLFTKSKKNPRIEPLASNVVQLVLFGSAPQAKCGLISSRKRHISLPDKVMGPPEVLSVNINPMRRHSSESMPIQESKSVKERIQENWRRSFLPTSAPWKRKQKTHKFSSSPIGSPEKRTLNLNKKTQCHPSLKSSRFFFSRQQQQERAEKTTVPTNQPAVQARANAENENCALQKNSTLSFSVLPSTFTFKCGSNQRKDTNNSIPKQPLLLKIKTSDTTLSGRGKTQLLNPEKKHHPSFKPLVPKKFSSSFRRNA